MKKALFSVFFLFFFISYSQQKQFNIEWSEDTTLFTATSSVTVPSFNKKNFSYDPIKGITYTTQWVINQPINERSFSVTNVIYETVSKTDLKDLNLNIVPNNLNAVLKNSSGRDRMYAFLQLSPIIFDNGIYKKVLSFNLSYQDSPIGNNVFSTNIISNSVLENGDWYKFYIDKTGIFRLSKSFLDNLGINTSSIDPRTIKVFGQGGQMLPLPNAENYPIDLTENPVKFVGLDDGVFNNGDYILFYGVGPTGFNSESNTNNNIFTDRACYFININSGGNAKQVQPYIEPSGIATETINTFHDYQFHEVDDYNLASLGRRWFGDRFDFENDKTFDFEFPNLITSEPISLKVYAAAVGEVVSNMSVKVNGNEVDNFFFPPINDPILATQDFYDNSVLVNSSDVQINLAYDNNGAPSSIGYLDYISIEGTRSLIGIGTQFGFRNNNVSTLSGIGQYDISNASDITEVWDVTDKYNITAISNDANATISFKATLGELREYVAIDPSNYYQPISDSRSRIENQNIKGTVFLNERGEFQDVDYIIVAREDMLGQAERLAQINREQYGLNVKVYELQKIYNEFSSGNQDVSGIRNLVKYVYDNASAPDKRLKYLCLFGDASYDYKDRVANNTNVVPSWHSLRSFSLSSSFVSDDFYGMMDDSEGGMHTSDRLDIAVGRILADTPQRAREMVDKVASYYASEAFGNWRNNFLVISDDVDKDWEGILQQTTNSIGDDVTQNKPFINVLKVHSDAFVQESTAGGERYPSVNKAIFDNIEVGALVVNYFGHGGEDGLASERIFDKLNAQELKNVCKLNCFVTVTCEYTKFDNPLRVTAGEFLYWNKEGGAIGLITTTRQIFVNVGVSLNVILEKYLFGYGTSDYPSMAEALRLTKNDPGIAGVEQRRLVFFIGDPAMKLAIPKPNIVLTEINDQPVSGSTDVLEALSHAKLKGEVVDESGNLLSNYNGVLTATIFDKNIARQTLANDGTRDTSGQIIQLDYETLGETIFRGQASIQNGVFEFDFIVPRDIGIPVGNGKVSFYAKSDSPLQDQAGANFDVQIGGINDSAAEDNLGPNITLFMNDENFVSGGITNESPTLLAKLQDDNGINTASGIGHDIIAILDGDETNPFKLNDYYQTEVDDYQNGTVTYPFRDLEPGLHTLTLKAWDVYNNSSTSEIQFVVYDENESLVIDNVLNYPNPFVNYTEFWFNHNSSDILDVSVQVFTVSGKLVKTINGQTTGGAKSTSSVSKDIVWDGRDDFGEKIGKGVYVYKLTVRSNQLNKQVEKFQKLVIL